MEEFNDLIIARPFDYSDDDTLNISGWDSDDSLVGPFEYIVDSYSDFSDYTTRSIQILVNSSSF